MRQLELAINFFVALFALLDAVGNVPLFAAATASATDAQRRRVALYIAAFAFAFLVFFFFTGLSLLRFFGISMPAFKIAGGLLLLLLGLEMARDDFTATFAAAAAKGEAKLTPRAYALANFERLIVPFGIPMLIGPGAISTVIIYASQSGRDPANAALAIAAILANCLVLVFAFGSSGLITRVLGRIGMTIVVRILGLIVCAIAIQFTISGLAGATRGVILPEAAEPYGPAQSGQVAGSSASTSPAR